MPPAFLVAFRFPNFTGRGIWFPTAFVPKLSKVIVWPLPPEIVKSNTRINLLPCIAETLVVLKQ